ncbi:MAG: WD40 repeat domain-containing protein [Elainellaceae cyanobacterium]
MRATLNLTQRWRDRLSDYVTAIAWSTDGVWLAAASSAGEVLLFDRAQDIAQNRVVLKAADGKAVNTLGFSADGQYLAAAGQSGTLTIWALQPNYPIAFSQSHPGVWIDQLAWHPSQTYQAYGAGPQVKIWDGTNTAADLDFQSSSVLHLAWHPRGHWLTASGHGGMKVWNAADWAVNHKTVAVPGASLYAAWSADGRYLASGNLDRTLTVVEWDSPPPWLMQGFPGKVRQVAWSEAVGKSGDPLLAAACAEGVTLWRRSDGGKRDWRSQVLQHHTGRVNAIAFQPKSLRLASAGEDGSICLWEMKKTPSKVLKFPEGGCSALAWHPSEELLAIAGTAGEFGVWALKGIESKGFG